MKAPFWSAMCCRSSVRIRVVYVILVPERAISTLMICFSMNIKDER
jgi:phage terminase large subunit-like protein